MNVLDLIPQYALDEIEKRQIPSLRPSQEKSVEAGLFDGKNLLVCTPTASGKTFVGELGMMKAMAENKKAVYVVPLKALASEKYRQFRKNFPNKRVAMTSGDMDGDDRHLINHDLIITTSEKLDSLIRHHAPWIKDLGVVVIDEIHLLNDFGRGPTLEVLITLLKRQLKGLQMIGLSATIGNAKELSLWLDAELVEDKWRPVRLDKGVYTDGKIYFPDKE